MKEKIKKIILWVILIWFALVFAGSFIEVLTGLSDNRLISLCALIISGYIVVKLQEKLNVRNLFRQNEPKN